MQVTLTATNGSLTLGGISGLSSMVYGPDNASVTFTGDIDNINAALQGLLFNPLTNHNGGASLRITTTDLGTGKTADNSLPISIVAINQPSTIGLPSSPTIYDFQTFTFSAVTGNAIVIGDPDIDPQTSAVTVVNGDFESPNVGVGPNSDAYTGAIAGWTNTARYWTNAGTVPNASGVAGNGAGIGNPNSTDWQPSRLYSRRRHSLAERHVRRGRHLHDQLPSGLSPVRRTARLHDPGRWRQHRHVQSDQPRFPRLQRHLLRCGRHRSDHVPRPTETSDKTAFIDDVSIAKTNSFVQVSLSVDYGKLNMADKNGLVFAYGDGVNDTAMTFTGSLADVNAALNTLQFSPNAGYMGAADLRITTNDLGNVGLGGPKSVTRTFTINVRAMNAAPWNSVPSTTQGTYGNQPLVFSTAGSNGVTVGDPDAGDFPIQVTLSVGNGTLTLAGIQGVTITNGANGSGTVTLTGTIRTSMPP